MYIQVVEQAYYVDLQMISIAEILLYNELIYVWIYC